VYVKNVDTPVAVVVVSGLKQWDDHMVVIEELATVCKSLESALGTESLSLKETIIRANNDRGFIW
jgi:uncharacterized protein (UPF0303 family)